MFVDANASSQNYVNPHPVGLTARETPMQYTDRLGWEFACGQFWPDELFIDLTVQIS